MLLRVVCTNVMCCYHPQGSYRRGARCTYAHFWDERLEWICPICTKDDKFECDMKWEHILKYIQLGPYQVENGQTVAEFMKSLN